MTVHLLEGRDGGGGGAGAEVVRHELQPGCFVTRPGGRVGLAGEEAGRHFVLDEVGHVRSCALRGGDPAMALRLHPRGLTTPGQQTPGAVGMGGGEEAGHVDALRDTEHERSFGAGGVEHGLDVVGALLQRGRVSYPVGEAGSSLVESNQPREASQTPHEPCLWRQIPIQIKVRDRAGGPKEVDRAGPAHLIRHVDIPADRVARFRTIHLPAHRAHRRSSAPSPDLERVTCQTLCRPIGVIAVPPAVSRRLHLHAMSRPLRLYRRHVRMQPFTECAPIPRRRIAGPLI